MKGLFITFEGIDGCGKTTQAELLKNVLEHEGYQVVYVREPGGTNISEKIRTILLSPENMEMSPVTESILLAASRSQLTLEIIKPAIRSGKIVICDRYIDSTLAYQGYGRGLDLKWLSELNRVATDGTVANITFYLDVPAEISISRMKGKKYDRMEREGIEFQNRIRSGYLSLAEKEQERYIVLDGNKSINDLHKKIWEIVKQKLER